MILPALSALRACADDDPNLKARYADAQIAYEYLVDEELAHNRKELEAKIQLRHESAGRDKQRRELDAKQNALRDEVAAEITDFRNSLMLGLALAIHKLRHNGRVDSVEKFIKNSISREGKAYFRGDSQNILPNASTNSRRRTNVRIKLSCTELTEEQRQEAEHSKLKRIRGADQTQLADQLNGEMPGALNSAPVVREFAAGYMQSSPYIPSRIAEQYHNEKGVDSAESVREELTLGFNEQQLQVFDLLAEGRSKRDIAEQLGIKECEVRKVYDLLFARAQSVGMLPSLRQAS